MNLPITFSVDIAGILALIGVLWGFLKMSTKLDVVAATQTEIRGSLQAVGVELQKIVAVLADHGERLGIVEDRYDRKRH